MNAIIKERRLALGLTLEEVGNAVGVSRATVQRWESGSIANMKQSRIKALADILQISTAQLVGEDTPYDKPKYVKIPVLGRVAAGLPMSAVEEILDYEEVPFEWTQNSEIFALQIKGDSMEPRITEGDVVIVRRQSDVDSNQIAIVLVNGDDATCKRVVKHADGITLIATNPKYTPMSFTKEQIIELPVTILGRVIELRAKFN